MKAVKPYPLHGDEDSEDESEIYHNPVDDLSSLLVSTTSKSVGERLFGEASEAFYRAKTNLTKSAISWTYSIGLGYTSAQQSFDEHNDNLLREIIVEAQTLQRSNKDYLFYYASIGAIDELRSRLTSIEDACKTSNKDITKSEIYEHDVSGANIVHVAYLTMQYEVGHYLVQRYPDLASMPYIDRMSRTALKQHKLLLQKMKRLQLKMDMKEIEQRMPYVGENILHIAIVRRSYEEVRWLLDFYRDHRHSCPNGLARLLTSNARGKFFDVKGELYFGGYPLQFAVCSNDTRIFDLVYSFTVSLEDAAAAAVQVRGEEELTKLLAWDQVTADSSHVAQLLGPNVIFATDNWGNNVLHLCVLHSLDRMYQHVYQIAVGVVARELGKLYARYSESGAEVDTTMIGLAQTDLDLDGVDVHGYKLRAKVLKMPPQEKLEEWVAEESKRKVEERLALALNDEFHSPLTLAAYIINKRKDSAAVTAQKVKMFHFLFGKLKKKLWTYGPITLALVDLEGVEIRYRVKEHYNLRGREAILDAGNVVMHPALSWLCINDADAAILIPEIRKLIQTKWERVGYPFFILSFIIHTSLTVLLTLILIFINATPTAYPGYSTEVAVDVLYPIVTIIFLVMFLQEVHDSTHFQARFWHLRGIAKFDKAIRVIKILSFVSFCCFKAITANRGREDVNNSQHGATVLYDETDDTGIKISLTICIIVSWLHLYYFLMGFDTTGPFMLTMFCIISTDVPYFLNFYMIVVVAFACALSLLSNTGDPHAHYGFLHLLKAIWTLIQDTVGLNATHDVINTQNLYPAHLQWVADVLLTIYYIIVVILMINLLIAMISDTYAQYSSYNDAILLMAKYNIMHAMEKVMEPQELRDNRAKYTLIDDKIRIESHLGHSLRNYSSQKYLTAPAVSEGVNNEESMGNASRRNSGASIFGALSAAGASKNNHGDTGNNGTIPGIIRRDSNTGRALKERVENFRLRQRGGGTNSQQQLLMAANSESSEMRVCRYMFEMQSTHEGWWSSSQIDIDNKQQQQQMGNDLLMRQKITLFIIDPQNDFHEGGSLAVPGARADSHRIAEMIRSHGKYIHEIFVSMDSHYPCHIAHAVSWVDAEGNHPPVLTKITHDDVLKGRWRHRDDSDPNPKGEKLPMQEWVKIYTSSLERKARMKLTIWPEHYIVGTRGHSVVQELNDALQDWAQWSKRPVNYVMKAQNLRTEMYSALQAEVEDPTDQSTALNTELLSMLKISDKLLICGQAMSHCVNYTTRDLITNWDKDPSSLVLLTDGASPVSGFEREAEAFKLHCREKGISLCTIQQAFEGYRARTLKSAAGVSAIPTTTATPTATSAATIVCT